MDTAHPIKEWRKANGKTLAELAGDVGVSPSHLSEIENGNNEPSLELAVKLSTRTGIEISSFAGRRRQKVST
jgi:transcriptional regulator with XRE-family HTH domain